MTNNVCFPCGHYGLLLKRIGILMDAGKLSVEMSVQIIEPGGARLVINTRKTVGQVVRTVRNIVLFAFAGSNSGCLFRRIFGPVVEQDLTGTSLPDVPFDPANAP